MLLSIITPVYNSQQYLERCLESILAQTLTDFELILVNDGSTDESGKICDQYAQKDSRVRVIHQENAGQAAARNRALDCARGTYIGFVDSDDFIHPRMYEILIHNMLAAEACVSVGGYLDVYEDVNRQEAADVKAAVWQGKEFIRHCLMDRVPKKGWILWDKVFHRDCFEMLRMPEGRIYEDNAVVYKILYEADRIVDCDAPLYYYFCNPQSTVHQNFGLKNLDWLLVLEEMIEYFEKQQDQELLRKVNRSYLRALADLCKKVHENVRVPGIERKLKKKLYQQYRSEKKKYPISFRTHPDVFAALFPGFMKLYWDGCGLVNKITGR